MLKASFLPLALPLLPLVPFNANAIQVRPPIISKFSFKSMCVCNIIVTFTHCALCRPYIFTLNYCFPIGCRCSSWARNFSKMGEMIAFYVDRIWRAWSTHKYVEVLTAKHVHLHKFQLQYHPFLWLSMQKRVLFFLNFSSFTSSRLHQKFDLAHGARIKRRGNGGENEEAPFVVPLCKVILSFADRELCV